MLFDSRYFIITDYYKEELQVINTQACTRYLYYVSVQVLRFYGILIYFTKVMTHILYTCSFIEEDM